MKIATMLALSAVTFAASISASLAGPCSAEIDAILVRIDAALNAAAAVGPGAPEQSIVGGRDIQPTPNSVANAEAKVGDISPEAFQQARDAVARARAADAAGDKVACEAALTEAQRTIGFNNQ
jgi:hypothetical protein